MAKFSCLFCLLAATSVYRKPGRKKKQLGNIVWRGHDKNKWSYSCWTTHYYESKQSSALYTNSNTIFLLEASALHLQLSC
jgi:hypothetical protein